jgi:3-deoxy-D-manno-octulosonic-acid transferase
MTAKEIIEIVKESKLWASLTEKEKQEAVKYALKNAQLSITVENIS